MADLSDPRLPEKVALNALATVEDGLLILDEELHLTWVNEQLPSTFDLGDERAGLVGEHLSAIMPLDDVHICRSLITDLREVEESATRQLDAHLRTEHGRHVPVELRVTLQTGEGFDRALVVVSDITQRRQREQRVRVLTRLLRHDLRTKANVISGRMEILEEDVPAARAHHVGAIYDSLRELTELSDKTLEVHRTMLDTGDEPLSIDAVEVVDGVAATAADRFETANLQLDLPERAPVAADPALAIVLENLVENAVSHSDRPVPTVEITVEAAGDSGGEWVTITVADDGPGIPPTEVEPLVSGGETPLQHGSGLGLWLVKWVVEGFGGDLTFEDRDPRGTSVRIRLPAA